DGDPARRFARRPFHLPRVDASPDLQSERAHRIADADGAANSPRRPVEESEEAVAGGVDLHTGVLLDLSPHKLVVATEQLRPGMVATTSLDRKSTRLNSSHLGISYAVFCLKKKKKHTRQTL